MPPIPIPETKSRPAFAWRRSRQALVALGWLNVGIGMAGVVLPLLPTTPFLLVALWAFGKSSPRFHEWLHTHPRFSPLLQDWQQERAVPSYAKALALLMMASSVIWLATSDTPTTVVLMVSGGLACVALWIVTRARPSRRIREGEQINPFWWRSL